MQEVKEVKAGADNLVTKLDFPVPVIAEWSIIAILFAFLVRQVWLSFAKQVAADKVMLAGLVQHLQQTNQKLIDECLEEDEEM